MGSTRKIGSIEIYESKIEYRWASKIDPLSPLKIIAQRWGVVVGKEYVGPFELIRGVID